MNESTSLPNPKTVVAIIVYNRFDNMKRWIECWKKCDQSEADLVIVHNHDKGVDFLRYKSHCEANGIKYVPRKNMGFDIGAFQDICRGRLGGFDNDWNTLFWATDDTFPMQRDFLSVFTSKLTETTGLSCMHISNEYAPHIRTTGICLKKNVAERLVFPADPVTTKWQCYEFEHRGGAKTLLRQVESMGLKAEMVAPIESSPLWDSGHVYKRKSQHDNAFL